MKFFTAFTLSLSLSLTACVSPPPMAVRPNPEPAFTAQPVASPAWWNDAVFYEIYVRAFQDSDGDGNGDLKGLISRLDYLNDGDPTTHTDLGITALWLMPIFQAASHHGYDTEDYRQIEKDYGTLEDFKTLVKEAHRRGIHVIVDLVLNHTAASNPWFLKASSADPGQFADWYQIAPKPTFGGSWSKLPDGRRYYSNFGSSMPDLNFKNPAVTAEMLDITGFWLKETGLDGYRLDAIKHLVEDQGKTENSEATHAWLRHFYQYYKAVSPQAYTVGEIWAPLDTLASYGNDQIDQGFHFALADALVKAVRDGDGTELSDTLQATVDTLPAGGYATFLRNHDQNRLMNDLGGDETKARLAAGLLLTLPGTPYLYYGEEIGQFGAKPDPNIRRPMQWDLTLPYFGFTTGKPFGAKTPYKEGTDRSVALEQGDPHSLLNWYKELIALRQTWSCLRTGSWTHLETVNPAVVAWLRQDAAGTVVVVANLGTRSTADWSLTLWAGPFRQNQQLSPLLGQSRLTLPVLTVNAAGGFEAQRPSDSLAAGELAVYSLSPTVTEP